MAAHLPPPGDAPDPLGKDLSQSLYSELRNIAAGYFRNERVGHRLQPTAVLHEAWIKMRGVAGAENLSRTEILNLGAAMVRRVLVDEARRRDAQKRAEGANGQTLGSVVFAREDAQPIDILALNEALLELQTRSELQARLIELSFFGGLEPAEVAEKLGISRDVFKRESRMARAWLNRYLTRQEDPR